MAFQGNTQTSSGLGGYRPIAPKPFQSTTQKRFQRMQKRDADEQMRTQVSQGRTDRKRWNEYMGGLTYQQREQARIAKQNGIDMSVNIRDNDAFDPNTGRMTAAAGQQWVNAQRQYSRLSGGQRWQGRVSPRNEYSAVNGARTLPGSTNTLPGSTNTLPGSIPGSGVVNPVDGLDNFVDPGRGIARKYAEGIQGLEDKLAANGFDSSEAALKSDASSKAIFDGIVMPGGVSWDNLSEENKEQLYNESAEKVNNTANKVRYDPDTGKRDLSASITKIYGGVGKDRFFNGGKYPMDLKTIKQQLELGDKGSIKDPAAAKAFLKKSASANPSSTNPYSAYSKRKKQLKTQSRIKKYKKKLTRYTNRMKEDGRAGKIRRLNQESAKVAKRKAVRDKKANVKRMAYNRTEKGQKDLWARAKNQSNIDRYKEDVKAGNANQPREKTYAEKMKKQNKERNYLDLTTTNKRDVKSAKLAKSFTSGNRQNVHNPKAAPYEASKAGFKKMEQDLRDRDKINTYLKDNKVGTTSSEAFDTLSGVTSADKAKFREAQNAFLDKKYPERVARRKKFSNKAALTKTSPSGSGSQKLKSAADVVIDKKIADLRAKGEKEKAAISSRFDPKIASIKSSIESSAAQRQQAVEKSKAASAKSRAATSRSMIAQKALSDVQRANKIVQDKSKTAKSRSEISKEALKVSQNLKDAASKKTNSIKGRIKAMNTEKRAIKTQIQAENGVIASHSTQGPKVIPSSIKGDRSKPKVSMAQSRFSSDVNTKKAKPLPKGKAMVKPTKDTIPYTRLKSMNESRFNSDVNKQPTPPKKKAKLLPKGKAMVKPTKDNIPYTRLKSMGESRFNSDVNKQPISSEKKASLTTSTNDISRNSPLVNKMMSKSDRRSLEIENNSKKAKASRKNWFGETSSTPITKSQIAFEDKRAKSINDEKMSQSKTRLQTRFGKHSGTPGAPTSNANHKSIDPLAYKASQEFPMGKGKVAVKKYGKRVDGSPKGSGFHGDIKTNSGKVMTEVSIGVNLSGKEIQIPLIIPNSSPSDLRFLANGGKATKAMVNKAVASARKRIKEGRSPFLDEADLVRFVRKPKKRPKKSSLSKRTSSPQVRYL